MIEAIEAKKQIVNMVHGEKRSVTPGSERASGGSLEEISRLFGDIFTGALAKLPVGGWSGPVRSGYGLHLVRVSGRVPARRPALDEVHDALLRDYRQAKRDEANRSFYAALKARYRIRVENGVVPEVRDGHFAGERL